MIYNVFGGTLNLAQSINQSAVSCLRKVNADSSVTWQVIPPDLNEISKNLHVGSKN